MNHNAHDNPFRTLCTGLVCAIALSLTPVDAPAREMPPESGQRVVLVTGSTGGLGRETARALALRGDHVIIHGRDAERAQTLIDQIRADGKGSARFYRADFASLEEVRGLGEAVLADYDRLDVLVNNAGVFLSAPDERRVTQDGYEFHLQINYLAGYELIRILTPLLETSAPGRIVNVASAYRPLDFDNLMLERDYDRWQAYLQSKHAQIMMSFALADDLAERGITINALHPSALMNTDMVIEAGFEPKSSVETGRDALLRLIDEDVGTGKYFYVFDEVRGHPQAYDPLAQDRLLAVSQELMSGEAPSPDPGPVTVFKNVRLFDGESSIPAADVLVRGTRIELVAAPDDALEIPDGSALIDGSGLTLMPGLIDAHTHTFSRSMLERSLAFGVTTCVDMWTSVTFMQELRNERADGMAYDRADYLSSGIGATAPESHGTQFGPVPTLTAPDEADAFVAARLAEGSDHIKIIYDNFKMFDEPVPTLDFASLEAVIDAAHRRNMLAVAHSRDVEAYADVARAGGDGIVHAPVDDIPDGELVAALREEGMFVIPTLSVSTPSGPGVAEDPVLGPRLSEKELENLRKYSPMHRPGGDRISMDAVKALHEGGVTILAGSDSPNRGTATGVSIHQELEMLVAAGLTPAEALAAATSAPADAFGLTDRGRIRPGHRADLLLVEGDPASNIKDSRRVVGVWKAGRRHAAEP